MSRFSPPGQRAVDGLIFYFESMFASVGLDWTSDNDAEIEDIVANIMRAAVLEAGVNP